jgi:predicted O-methyltransferase YrrM
MPGDSLSDQTSLVRAALMARAGHALLRNPREAMNRARDMLAERRESPRRPYPYQADAGWHQTLHVLLGLPWPCSAEPEFRGLWPAYVDEMAAVGLALGRRSFGGWDDGGAELVLASYCLARHLRPQKVVETGVAHGVTTRFVLDALDRNGSGALWSIDLPPLVAVDLHDEIAVAVPEDRRARWTLGTGSSRRRLPGLLEHLGSIDLFIHDSIHTERNLRFELDQAWRSLVPGGALLADDVDYNPGFKRFVDEVPEARSVVARHDDLRRLFGMILKTRSVGASRPTPPDSATRVESSATAAGEE